MKPQINQRDSEGRRHGAWEGYWLNGSPKWRVHFLHGEPYGVRELYFPVGTLFNKSYYLNIK